MRTIPAALQTPCCQVAGWLLLSSVLLTGCDSGPPPKGKAEFSAANSKITSDNNGVAHGNTELAREMAQEFSDIMAVADKAAFTGHKKRLVSLTGEKFVTYCHHNGDQVAFLVHVPQLKNYKDDVRDALIEICWLVSSGIVEEKGEGKFKRLGVGLRGSLLYGGLAIGEVGSESPKTENAMAVDDDKLFPFFAPPAAESKKQLAK